MAAYTNAFLRQTFVKRAKMCAEAGQESHVKNWQKQLKKMEEAVEELAAAAKGFEEELKRQLAEELEEE